MTSIIIPVYQVERYLPMCLDSLLAQTELDWEAILVDDGSADSSGFICDSYAKADSRFRVIHQKNAGAANAKNAGLNAARGTYVAFLDSDDTVDPRWLEITLAAMKAADVVEYGFDLQRPCGYDATEILPAGEFGAEEYLNQYIDHWQCGLFWNKMFRAELLKEIRFRKERRCIDDEFFTYKVMSGAEKIVRITDVLYHYRQRKGSAVNNSKNALQRTKDALAIRQERYEWISSRFSRLRNKYLQRDLESLYYFAQAFPFDNEAAKDFRTLRAFYLRQCLNWRSGIRSLRLALGLLCLSEKKITNNPVPEVILQAEDCFD